MRTIYKYPLGVTGEQKVSLPEGAEPLCVQVQTVPAAGFSRQPIEQLVLWALVDTDKPSKDMTISIFGTGNPVAMDLGLYLGTVQMNSGLVWHVFCEVT